MTDFLLYPSSLMWDSTDYANNPHRYDDIISSFINILLLQDELDFKLTLIEDFTNKILEYFPFQDISRSHHTQRVDFVNLVTTAVAKWMSEDNTAESKDINALNDNVSAIPRLFQIDNDPEIDRIEKRSNSWVFNKPDCVAIALNYFQYKNIDLQNNILNAAPHIINGVYIIDNANSFKQYVESNRLICQFSPKHHPTSGWGSKMPHEELDLMQSLLEESIFEENQEHRIRYARCGRDNLYYAFRVTNGRVFHPYPIPLAELPNSIVNRLNNQV